VKERYNEWMISNYHAFTPTGKIKCPSYSTVASWVKDSWEEVDVDLIKNSFKCCGVSTKLDGSEDDLLFEYDKLLGSVDDDEEVEDPNNQDSDVKYPEEGNYKNDWNIDNKIDDEFDDEDDNEDHDREKEKRQDKGKGKEKNNEKEDEYQEESDENFSSDDEDLRKELQQKYKRNYRNVGTSY
jgi:hypothetical protein